MCFALCQDMAVNESACRNCVWDYAELIQSPALPDEEHDRGLLKNDFLRNGMWTSKYQEAEAGRGETEQKVEQE